MSAVYWVRMGEAGKRLPSQFFTDMMYLCDCRVGNSLGLRGKEAPGCSTVSPSDGHSDVPVGTFPKSLVSSFGSFSARWIWKTLENVVLGTVAA